MFFFMKYNLNCDIQKPKERERSRESMNCIGAERSFQALSAWADHVWEVASGSIVVVVEVGKSGSRAWGGVDVMHICRSAGGTRPKWGTRRRNSQRHQSCGVSLLNPVQIKEPAMWMAEWSVRYPIRAWLLGWPKFMEVITIWNEALRSDFRLIR